MRTNALRANRSTRRRTLAIRSATAMAATGLVAAGLQGVALPAASAAVDCTSVPWGNPAMSADARATALLDASTQQQKYRWLVEQPANSPTQTVFSGVTYPEQVPCTPTVVYTDGPDGVRFTDGVTAFPAPIAVASTWNEGLAEDKGRAQAAEAFDKGKNVVLGPGIASGRTPLSGRTPEYFGEDGVLSGTLAAATVRGLQDGEDGKAVLANLKHYVANEQELDRQSSSSNVDARTLAEVYDLPFEIAVKESDPASVMCSYNQINGTYACENPLLNQVLKGRLGFQGYVMSDFGAVHTTAASLVNGMDQELNRPRFLTPANLDAALAAGEVTQQQIDAAAFRVVRAYIAGGLFDHPLAAAPVADATTAEHRQVARELAEQGTVLLKNSGLLPLRPTAGQRIGVVGPTASATPTNGVSAKSVCAMNWRFSNGPTLNCEKLVAAEDAIRARAAQDGASVVFDDGSDVSRAAATAASVDVVVVFGYTRQGEFSDLADLHLQGNGDALVSAVAAANPRTAVVLQTGSAVEMPWLDRVSAVLEAWYAGEQQGPALASILFGDSNPSGKLPMTFPKSLADTPTAQSLAQYPGVFANGSPIRPPGSTEIRQVTFSERLKVGYRWYDSQGIEPLFAFGDGLSYTTFGYSHLQVTPQTTDGTKEIRVQFRLTNTGNVAGEEVAQVYLTLPGVAGETQRLVGWTRVALGPGEFRNVTVTLSQQQLHDRHLLQYVDGSGSWVTPAGTFGIAVGGSSRNQPVETTFAVH